MDFGQPNAEIGRKMANGRLLFLVLINRRGLPILNISKIMVIFKVHRMSIHMITVAWFGTGDVNNYNSTILN